MKKIIMGGMLLMISLLLCDCGSDRKYDEMEERISRLESLSEKRNDKATEHDEKGNAIDDRDGKTTESPEVVEITETLEIDESSESDVVERSNTEAPSDRVYDYADVLTDAEEMELTKLISEAEKQCKCDIILVTTDMEVGISDSEWSQNMMSYADDFYDQNAFGYDKPHGDGALFLDNWYLAGTDDSQAGTWLSTSGRVMYVIGAYEEDLVWEALDAGFDISAYRAYENAISKLAELLAEESL